MLHVQDSPTMCGECPDSLGIVHRAVFKVQWENDTAERTEDVCAQHLGGAYAYALTLHTGFVPVTVETLVPAAAIVDGSLFAAVAR